MSIHNGLSRIVPGLALSVQVPCSEQIERLGLQVARPRVSLRDRVQGQRPSPGECVVVQRLIEHPCVFQHRK